MSIGLPLSRLPALEWATLRALKAAMRCCAGGGIS